MRTIKANAASPLYLAPGRCRPRVLEAPQSGPPDIFARHTRESTVDKDEDEDVEGLDDLAYEACMRVTFDCIPKTGYGLRAGRSNNAELRLPELPRVSYYHFALTFNAEYCLVVRDLGSKCGTTVAYDGMERDRRISFDWIVGGSDFLQKVKTVTVNVSLFLQFRLVIPPHNVGSESYRAKVDRFRAGSTDADQLLDLGHIGLSSRVGTTALSGVQTRASGPDRPVTVRKKLGTDSFAVVYHV